MVSLCCFLVSCSLVKGMEYLRFLPLSCFLVEWVACLLCPLFCLLLHEMGFVLCLPLPCLLFGDVVPLVPLPRVGLLRHMLVFVCLPLLLGWVVLLVCLPLFCELMGEVACLPHHLPHLPHFLHSSLHCLLHFLQYSLLCLLPLFLSHFPHQVQGRPPPPPCLIQVLLCKSTVKTEHKENKLRQKVPEDVHILPPLSCFFCLQIGRAHV